MRQRSTLLQDPEIYRALLVPINLRCDVPAGTSVVLYTALLVNFSSVFGFFF